MEEHVVIPAKVDFAAREAFYRLIGQVPESVAAWQGRQATLNLALGPPFRAILAVHRSHAHGRFRLLPTQGRRYEGRNGGR